MCHLFGPKWRRWRSFFVEITTPNFTIGYLTALQLVHRITHEFKPFQRECLLEAHLFDERDYYMQIGPYCCFVTPEVCIMLNLQGMLPVSHLPPETVSCPSFKCSI